MAKAATLRKRYIRRFGSRIAKAAKRGAALEKKHGAYAPRGIIGAAYATTPKDVVRARMERRAYNKTLRKSGASKSDGAVAARLAKRRVPLGPGGAPLKARAEAWVRGHVAQYAGKNKAFMQRKYRGVSRVQVRKNPRKR